MTSQASSAPAYLCVHCDHRFTYEGEGKLRCPKCLRKGGLEKVADDRVAVRPRWLVPAAIAGVLALVGGGYAAWARFAPKVVEGPAPLAVLDEPTLRAYLRNAKAESDELARILTATSAVERFAKESVGSAKSPQEKVAAVVHAIRARAAKQAFVPWSMHSAEPSAVRSPEATLEVMRRDGARARLYPLEVAVLAVAALRAEGVAAMVAEAWTFPGDRRPPDPSGQLGYFIVAAYANEVGQGAPILADPYGGRTSVPTAKDYRVLTDAQVAAAALSLDALRILVRKHDVKAATEAAEKALRLDARAPYVRSAHAAVVLTAGGLTEGLEELATAAQIRPDAPRHNNIARLRVAQGDLNQASIEVAAALKENPDFAAAHATLAAILFAQQDIERARAELETVGRLDPAYPLLPILWAGYHAQRGELPEAVARAREAVRLQDYDAGTRLQAAQIFRAAGEYGEMREQARAVVELTPEAQKATVRQQLLAALGPTVFDEHLTTAGSAAPEPAAPEPAAPGNVALPTPKFDLGSGSAEPGAASGVGRLDDDSGDLKLGGGSGFRLGGGSAFGGRGAEKSDEKLKLRLNE